MLLKETTTHVTSKLDHLKVDVSMEPKNPILVGSWMNLFLLLLALVPFVSLSNEVYDT